MVNTSFSSGPDDEWTTDCQQQPLLLHHMLLLLRVDDELLFHLLERVRSAPVLAEMYLTMTSPKTIVSK